MSPFVPASIERARAVAADLCRALGVDPARVIDVEWHADRPTTVRLVLVERHPETDQHLTEDHPVPEGWAP